MILFTNLPLERTMQSVMDARVNRTKHVWRKLRRGEGYKCVLCGGITQTPSDDIVCRRYEKLDDDDRRLCGQEKSNGALISKALSQSNQASPLEDED